MKYAFLVAWREFAENAKTKGFWIGIFIMPLMLSLSIQVPIWLEEKATPVRFFVLVDRSAKYEGAIEAALEKAHQQKVLGALNDYARRYAAPTQGPGADVPLPRTLQRFKP